MTGAATDVAIVGGGLVGCWTAFHLRRRGVSATVLEREVVGRHASGVNFGSLRLQGRFLGQLPLALRAQEIWESLAALIGDVCEMETTGHLHVAFTAEQLAALTTYSQRARAYGLITDILDGAAIHRRWPWLAAKVVGGSWSQRDGAANPRLATPAVARAARAAGAVIREGAAITGAERRGAGFRLTTSDGDTIDCAALVNAAGAWAGTIAAAFGEAVPIFAAGPADMVTEPVPYFMGPTVQAADGSIVVRQIRRGNLVIAGHPRGPVDAARGTGRVLPRQALTNMNRLAALIPALAQVHVIRTWTGVEGYLPDMLPVIGPSRTTPGLVHGFGLSGHGFQIAPAVGVVLSELVADGRTSTPIADFAIDRFARGGSQAVALDEEFDPSVAATDQSVATTDPSVAAAS